jgi:hypothetical protein
VPRGPVTSARACECPPRRLADRRLDAFCGKRSGGLAAKIGIGRVARLVEIG